MAPADLALAIAKGGPRKRGRILLYLSLILLLLVIAGWWWWSHLAAEKARIPKYVTEVLHHGAVTLIITATGNLVPTNQVIVGSELSGTTLEVFVDINDRVTKGQALARLDTSKLAQQTESSHAAVTYAQAKAALAQATAIESTTALTRQQEVRRLSGGDIPSKLEIDTAIAAADRARADLLSTQASVAVAKAQVSINENDLAKAIIKSPIDGIVLTRSIEPGQTVAASFTAPQLFIIAEKLERMKLNVTIAEADIGRVTNGQPSTFTVDAWPDRQYSATVQRVAFGSAVTDNVVTYLAELAVNNDDLSLRPGMTATADIRVADSSNVFVVPAAALRFNPSAVADSASTAKKSFVQSLIPMPTRNKSRPTEPEDGVSSSGAHIWVLREGVPESIPVKAGLSDGHHTEISGADLNDGLIVILRVATPPA